jgi:signal transduction histidine kinase
MVEQAVNDTQPFADGFGVRLRLEPGADMEVRADRDRIVQVAVNLLSNAAKFSPRGAEVEVTVEVLDDRVRVAVADCGPGVPEEFRTRMFERFAQADTSDRRLKGGTGLGLNICRSIMTAHGGRIDFTSVPGVRTEFFFELPRPGNDAAAD